MVELLITLREGGEEREEKIKLGMDGSPVTVEQITNRLYKYQMKKKTEVTDMRVRIVRVEEHIFTLDDDGEFLMDGQPIDEEDILGDGSEIDFSTTSIPILKTKPTSPPPPPPPPPIKDKVSSPPLKIIDAPAPQSENNSIGNIDHLTEEQRALIMEAQAYRQRSSERDPYVKQGLLNATPQEIMEFAPDSAEKTLMGQIGGGRNPKKVPPGTPMAAYAAEYYLFDPLPKERQNGITTIGYPRIPVFFKYQPPYRPNEFRLLFPKNTGVRAISFAVRNSSRMWEITDGKKIASVPEMHLVSAPTGPGLEPEHFDQLDYAPDNKDTLTQQQFSALMQAQKNNSGGVQENLKVDLEMIDSQPKNNEVYRPKGPVTDREIQQTIEQQAIMQAEQMDPYHRKNKGLIISQ